jgi:hypothetical protein
MKFPLEKFSSDPNQINGYISFSFEVYFIEFKYIYKLVLLNTTP